MKYTIEGFNQEYALSLRKSVEVRGRTITRKIDCADLVILRWFVDFYPNTKKVTVDGVQYAHITHKKLLNDLPLIDITKRAFMDRMQKLVDFEILTYQLLKDGGTFSLYGFGKNYSKLIESDAGGCAVQTTQGMLFEQHRVCCSNDIGYAVQTTHKDYSINNSSIDIECMSKSTSRFTPPTLEQVKEYCMERKNIVDAERFVNYYTANGWKVGKNSMKDWKAAVRTWERGEQNKQTYNGRNYSKAQLDSIFNNEDIEL